MRIQTGDDVETNLAKSCVRIYALDSVDFEVIPMARAEERATYHGSLPATLGMKQGRFSVVEVHFTMLC